MPKIWPITVASAAPVTPISGNGPMPKIISGSRMMLMIAPVRPCIIGMIMLPVDCCTFSHIIEIMTKMLRPTAICEYCTACTDTSSAAPKAFTNTPESPKPSTRNTMPPMMDSAMPCSAAEFACIWRFSPRRRAISEFTPTPVPTPIATTSVCSGNTSETAASALCEYCATKMLSTMLYSALIIMDTMAGSAMEKISGPMRAVPILFCSTILPPNDK